MKIFLDFDRTLYDLDALHEDSRRIVERHGIPREEYDRTRAYFAYGSGTPGVLHRPEAHLGYFTGIDDGQRARVVADIRGLIRDGARYVFEDALDFFRDVSRRHELVVLTFGDEEYQRTKVLGSGLKPDGIIVTAGDKWEVMASKLLDGEKALFVDDHVNYFSKPKDIPGLTAVHLVRSGSCALSECCAHHHVAGLREMSAFLYDKGIRRT